MDSKLQDIIGPSYFLKNVSQTEYLVLISSTTNCQIELCQVLLEGFSVGRTIPHPKLYYVSLQLVRKNESVHQITKNSKENDTGSMGNKSVPQISKVLEGKYNGKYLLQSAAKQSEILGEGWPPKSLMERTERTNLLDLILQREGIRKIREIRGEEQKGRWREARGVRIPLFEDGELEVEGGLQMCFDISPR